MTRSILVIATLALSASLALADEETYYRDLAPDTWVGVDALGRQVPDFTVVGPPKDDQRRVVGIFYITWHSESLAGVPAPFTGDVTRILEEDPSARLDANHPLWRYGSYHWGEPEMGYFLSQDEWVVRKDMSMLADAGVDVLVMDVTNAVRYWDEWEVVFSTMEKMRAEGNRTPSFCFWAFNGPVITVVEDLYRRIYEQERFKDLWFSWDGKPLLLYNGNPAVDAAGGNATNPNPIYDPAAATDPKHPHYGDPDYTAETLTDYSDDVKSFFTLRTMWWGYYEWGGKRFVGTEDNWSFGLDMADTRVQALGAAGRVSTHDGQVEEAAVTPAQHPSSLVGKSWTPDKGEPPLNDRDMPEPTYVPWLGETVENPEGYGIYFQQRWDEALSVDPQFLYLNDWNEWTAGKYQPGGDGTTPFMGRQGTYFFVDQYNAEFNRCIQPMKDGYTDNYYYQMVQGIRHYKGARPAPQSRGLRTIRIDGGFADWDRVKVEYRDTLGDTASRDHAGYGGLHYRDNSGRNDIVTSKVAVTKETVSFLAEAAERLSPSTGRNWMLLLIDSDKNPETGWYGYDWLVNRSVRDEDTTTLCRWTPQAGGDPWQVVAEVPYRVAGERLELALPRKLLGLEGDSVSFDFHWADNPESLEDPIALCVKGDNAPNRRFNYRFLWER